jgi:hypothetical protein
MSIEEKPFPDQLRELADRLEDGTMKDVAVITPIGWSASTEAPMTMVSALFDAMCSMRDMQRQAIVEAELKKRQEAPQIVIPQLKLN